jgi:hypothetical protein
MKVKLQGHTRRRERAIKLWRKMAKDYKKGMEVKDIAIKHKRTDVHVYWALRELNKIDTN